MIISEGMCARAPEATAPHLAKTRSANSLDFHISVSGGGVTGQSTAQSDLESARALVELEPTFARGSAPRRFLNTRIPAWCQNARSPASPKLVAASNIPNAKLTAIQSAVTRGRLLRFLFRKPTGLFRNACVDQEQGRFRHDAARNFFNSCACTLPPRTQHQIPDRCFLKIADVRATEEFFYRPPKHAYHAAFLLTKKNSQLSNTSFSKSAKTCRTHRRSSLSPRSGTFSTGFKKIQ